MLVKYSSLYTHTGKGGAGKRNALTGHKSREGDELLDIETPGQS